LKKKKDTLRVIRYLILGLILFVSKINPAQSKTNLEIFTQLLDSSVVKLVNEININSNKIKFEFNQESAFPTFRNSLLFDLKNKIEVVNKNSLDEKVPVVHYSIEKASVNYGEMFRDGFLGDYLVPRKIKLEGLYSIINENVNVYDFNYSSVDTVFADNLDTIENKSLPFTEGKHPTEPFFSSLFEPLIAVGSAALAVILFFTIRSK